MNDQEYEEVKRRIVTAVRDWMSALGLGWWNVVMDYDRRGLAAIAAEITARYADAEMRVVWNAPMVQQMTDGELSLAVLRLFLRAAFLDEVAEDASAMPRVAHLLAKTITNVRNQQRRPSGSQGIRDTVNRATRHLGVIEDPNVRAAPD